MFDNLSGPVDARLKEFTVLLSLTYTVKSLCMFSLGSMNFKH